MERLSTIVVQKLLDGFFLGLDAVDAARRKVDHLLGRPEEAPFEVQWPEPPATAAPPANSESKAQTKNTDGKKSATPAAKDKAAAKSKPAGSKKVARKSAKKKPSAKTTPRHPKVTIEIEELSEKVKKAEIKARPLHDDDELGGKKMIARIVYVLGVAEEEALGGLSSTEIAHVLTFAQGIETFGTNISRAIRQGTAGMVENMPGTGRIQRYTLTEKGKQQFKAAFGR